MDDMSRMASDLESLAEVAKGDSSLLATDVLRFADKWIPKLSRMDRITFSPMRARRGRGKPVDVTGITPDMKIGKIDHIPREEP